MREKLFNKMQCVPLVLWVCLLLTPFQSMQAQKQVASVPPDFELTGMTIEMMQQKLQQGEYTSVQIVKLYLDRIKQIDQSGPALHAVIELNPDALSIAARMDKERARHQIRGPMHGIPVIIKDNIDTDDAMHTTAGSLAMLKNKPEKDAYLVSRLREAGAIILGKANLSEWANFRSYNSVSGWSSRGGQTINPYLFDQTPCGSSSGSAVAVAADLCMVSIGTETDGSIACPASMNAVVGIKPTVGLVSRSGIIPISKSQDSPGPMARSVRDAAVVLSVISGYDPSDATTSGCTGHSPVDYTTLLDTASLKGKRIGVDKTMLHQPDPIGVLMDEAIAVLQKEGALIVEVDFTSNYTAISDIEFDLLKYEFKDGLNQYLAQSKGPMKSLEDIIRFNRENAMQVMPSFQQEIMEDAQAKGGLNSGEYIADVSSLLAMKKHIDDLMTSNDLDALCGAGSGAYSPAAVAGYPSITVPMGLADELPVGITFFGRAFDEAGLLCIAYGYEQASHRRTEPKFLPTYVKRQ